MNKFLLLLLTILLLAGTACSLFEEEVLPTATFPAVNTPTLAAVTATLLAPASATSLPATATSPPATATATATVPPPSSTPLPASATPLPATASATTPAGPTTERIVFASGASGATIAGDLGPVESDRYILRALADQIMSVQVTTPGNATMLLSIQGADGTLLKRDAVGGPAWSGPLPATQDYTISIRTAGEAAATYTLQVEISPLAAPAPQQITFAPGATSATVEGTLASQGDVQQYVLRAMAGQRMEVQVISDLPGVVVYSLRDSAGQTLAITTDPTPLVAFLPQAGDYLITLTTHNIAPAVDYALTVEITDAGTIPPPERIIFPPGTTGTTVAGTLPSGGSKRYILSAQGGQTMTLDVAAEPAGAMSILVETEGGSFLTAGTDQVPLTLTLPTTQDYRIILTTPFAAPAVTYELRVEIR